MSAKRIDPAGRGTHNVRVARPKLFKDRVNLNVLLSQEMLDRLDAAREEYQSRLDFIRRAIDREIERVERKPKGRKPVK